eukprot:CAMPEP_0201532630 /NCGR_PEP_ID=MMETSP0161_2-20130828/50920_1 /ASSEMBLY_ACC=CAM_ASM_000251 /TAXON_ID=180227 /ORGANISM="Neoparamoeba aestuarina, Strain SoJaBio B1-5/56/2" /LENGTH=54 /DNA_ID=CAMNT_0047936155 /DNA_START=114 /DNA_END=278 /DNA_ORIENTATION=+
MAIADGLKDIHESIACDLLQSRWKTKNGNTDFGVSSVSPDISSDEESEGGGEHS